MIEAGWLAKQACIVPKQASLVSRLKMQIGEYAVFLHQSVAALLACDTNLDSVLTNEPARGLALFHTIRPLEKNERERASKISGF